LQNSVSFRVLYVPRTMPLRLPSESLSSPGSPSLMVITRQQARHVRQLCRGQDLDTPPDNLFYLSALGHPAKEAFASALDACKEHEVGLMVVDSLGPALQGDAEAARDVIGFFQRSIEPI
jgi:hypothetical protein